MEQLVRALLVIDVQNDFCEGGALPVAHGAEIARRITQFIRQRVGTYELILASQDCHVEPKGHFSSKPDFVFSWSIHALKGSYGSQLHQALDSSLIDHVIYKGEYKGAFSAFEGITSAGEYLLELLERREIEVVDICGIATDFCVLHTALDAIDSGFPTTVFLDLIGGVSEQGSIDALEELQSRGVNLDYGFSNS